MTLIIFGGVRTYVGPPNQHTIGGGEDRTKDCSDNEPSKGSRDNLVEDSAPPFPHPVQMVVGPLVCIAWEGISLVVHRCTN